MAKVAATGELIINASALASAHLHAGDEVAVVVDGDGRLIVERRAGRDRRATDRGTPDRRTASALTDGIYPRDYLFVASSDECLHGRVAATVG